MEIVLDWVSLFNLFFKNIEILFGDRKVEYVEKKGKTEKIVTWKKISDLEKASFINAVINYKQFKNMKKWKN